MTNVTKDLLIEIIAEQVKWWLLDECELPFYHRLDRDHLLRIDEEWDDSNELNVSLREETGDDRYPEDTIYEESIPKEYDEDGNGSELIEEIASGIMKSLGCTEKDYFRVLQKIAILAYKRGIFEKMQTDMSENEIYDVLAGWAEDYCSGMCNDDSPDSLSVECFINKKLG